jgi:hypothetical protein
MAARRGLRVMGTAALLAVVMIAIPSAGVAGAKPSPSAISAHGGDNAYSVDGNIRPGRTPTSISSSAPYNKTQTDDCGTPPEFGHLVTDLTDQCAQARNTCSGYPQKTSAGKPLTIISTRILINNIWTQGPIDCSAATAPPGLDQAAIHDAFVKLLPKPTIKTAPPDHTAITGIETLLWLDTPTTINLGTTPLLGHQVSLTATVQSVTWNFGDNTTDTTTGPSRPFLDNDYCNTPTCPDWFGHTYTHTATITLTATTTWTGRYSTDNGPYQPIHGTVTTTPQTTDLHIQQSHGILVPNTK